MPWIDSEWIGNSCPIPQIKQLLYKWVFVLVTFLAAILSLSTSPNPRQLGQQLVGPLILYGDRSSLYKIIEIIENSVFSDINLRKCSSIFNYNVTFKLGLGSNEFRIFHSNSNNYSRLNIVIRWRNLPPLEGSRKKTPKVTIATKIVPYKRNSQRNSSTKWDFSKNMIKLKAR